MKPTITKHLEKEFFPTVLNGLTNPLYVGSGIS
jgi:hypothetical protein